MSQPTRSPASPSSGPAPGHYLAHGVFLLFVVIGSLGTGALRAAGADVLRLFIVAAALMTVAGAAVLGLGDGPAPGGPGCGPVPEPG